MRGQEGGPPAPLPCPSSARSRDCHTAPTRMCVCACVCRGEWVVEIWATGLGPAHQPCCGPFTLGCSTGYFSVCLGPS